MSEVDLLIESTITEAPVGILKRGALKVASKLGSQKAAGQEVTANIANQLKKDYSRYLGLTGYEPDKESIEAFLNSKGLSADSLDAAISSATDGGDWRIDTGARTTATNQKVEPVVDIGSATGEVPSLDGESPIEKARAKRIAAQQKAVQQLRGQQPQSEPTTKPNRLAGMGAGYVPPSEPTAQEPAVSQQEPSASGTQAAAALSRLKKPQNPMKGRTSLVSKLKGQPAEPEVSTQEPTATRERPGISARAGKINIEPKVPQFTSASAMSKATAEKKAELDTKLQAIDDAKAALDANPKDRKLKAILKKAETDYDAFVSNEIKPADLTGKLNAKVAQIKSGEPEPTSTNSPVSKPQSKYGKGLTGVHRAAEEQRQKRDAAMPAYNAAANDYLNAVKTAKTQDEKDAAAATFDEFRNKFIKDFGWGTDPMINDMLIPYPTIQSTTKPSTTQSGQMELPTEEPTTTSASPNADQDAIKKAEAEVENKRAAFEIAKRDNPNLKSLYQDTKNGFMGRLNTAIKALAKLKGEEPELETKPVDFTTTTTDVSKKAGKSTTPTTDSESDKASDEITVDEKPTTKPVKSNTKSKSTSENTDVKKTSDELIAAINAYNKDKSDEDLKHAVQLARLKYERAQTAAEAEDDETDNEENRGGLGSELNRFAKASEQVAKDKENDKKTNDAEQKAKDKALKAYKDAMTGMNTGKQTSAKQNKLDNAIEELVKLGMSEEDAAAEIKKQLATVSDSIEHEFDYLLAEAVLSNKQIDKIILAIAQDNIRKGIISVPGVQKPKGKTTKAAGDQYTSSSTGSSMGGSVSAPQYNQPRQQPSVGSKTLDLSNLNVKRLIGAINHILQKQELQGYEIRQLEKLMDELKTVKEARAIQANMLAEAPMGLGKRLATGVASKFSSQAAGKLDVGKIANQYKPEYSRWVGSTGSAPDAQSLIDFFQSKRLDTSKIQSIADSVAPGATRLNSQQIDSIIMQITQDNIRKGVISTSGSQQAGTSTQSNTPTAQSTLPVMAQRMLTDPAVQSHPEYVRFLSGLK